MLQALKEERRTAGKAADHPTLSRVSSIPQKFTAIQCLSESIAYRSRAEGMRISSKPGVCTTQVGVCPTVSPAKHPDPQKCVWQSEPHRLPVAPTAGRNMILYPWVKHQTCAIVQQELNPNDFEDPPSPEPTRYAHDPGCFLGSAAKTPSLEVKKCRHLGFRVPS